MYNNRTDVFFTSNESVQVVVHKFSPIQISAMVVGITCGLLAVPGVVLNILSIVVFSRVGKATLAIALYKLLALADSGVLLILAANWSPLAWHALFGDWIQYLRYISPALQYLNYVEETLRDFAVWMVVLVTLERYVKIYEPSLHFNWRPGCARYSVILLILVTIFNTYILITAPLDPMVGESSSVVNATYYTIDCIVNIVVPVALVLFMTVKIIMAIRRTQSARALDQHEQQNSRPDTAAARTLIIIAVVFLLCQIPVCFHLVIESMSHYTSDAEFLIPYSQAGSLIFQCVNSTINFFVFYSNTHKFRYKFLAMWHRNCVCIQIRLGRTPPPSSSSTTPLPILKRRNGNGVQM